MHHLHTLGFLIDKLAEGDRVVWAIFVGGLLVLAIAFVHDLRRNRRKGPSASEEG